ncbi:MAG: 4-hydroxy-tetrahydrodipicolinate synthase [Actinomycetota bacterium]|nr:4-hydroxy-tetrahydrodipicolinate synthase [Actinomycetota bacterium]
MAGRFGSVITAMVTPFRDDMSLDLDRAQAVTEWLLDHGSNGLVVAGTTGEGATLSDAEKADLWRATVEAAKGKGPIIAGTGTYDTAHSVHLTEEAEKAGCDAALVVSPYYNKPPQSGLFEHFTTVARATSLPVIVYNIPGRTAVRISNETLLRLAEVDNIVGVKDATADLVAAAELSAAAPDFEIISGEDALTFPLVCQGATGVISVTSHVAGERMGQMIDLIESGDVPAARKIQLELLPLYRALFITTSPIPVKAAMGLAGQPVGPPRLPLVPATAEETAAVKQSMGDVGVL